MNELAFEFDWDSMDGSRGAEIRSTWARFALFVDGVPLTEAHDLRTKSVREHIFIPLYPMAEWVSKHWWWLLYEAEGPARRDYERRHNLRHAREGFAFPNVSIRPTGERVTIEWWPISMPAEGVNFASKGSAVLPMEQVRETLSNFITVVLERLELQGVSDTHLHDEWDAVVSTDDEEAAFCISAARAGADPYDLSDSLTDAILNANERLPEHWQEEFFAAADSEQLHAQMTAVLGWRDVLKQNGVDLSALTSLRMQSEKIDPRRAPWEQAIRVRTSAAEHDRYRPQAAADRRSIGPDALGIQVTGDPQ